MSTEHEIEVTVRLVRRQFAEVTYNTTMGYTNPKEAERAAHSSAFAIPRGIFDSINVEWSDPEPPQILDVVTDHLGEA